jgi:hypothetical protein
LRRPVRDPHPSSPSNLAVVLVRSAAYRVHLDARSSICAMTCVLSSSHSLDESRALPIPTIHVDQGA